VLKVTLDMFSGRENPTMVAEGREAQRLLDEIASDQTIAAFSAEEEPPGNSRRNRLLSCNASFMICRPQLAGTSPIQY